MHVDFNNHSRRISNVSLLPVRALLVCCFGLIGLLRAQPPALSQNGVVNAASRIPSSLVNSELARGELFSVRGVRLGANVFQTHLELLSNGGSISFRPVFVQPTEIQALLPRGSSLGPASLVIETSEGRSKPFPIRVVPAQPGLFSTNGEGWGQGRITSGEVTRKPESNGIGAAVRRGAVITVAATGLASVDHVDVVVGGIRVKALRIQHSSKDGMDRVTFRIPSEVSEGCFVPIYVRTESSRPSNVVAAAIDDHGPACQFPIALPPHASGTGIVAIARGEALYSDSSPTTTFEQALAAFFDASRAGQIPSPLFAPPPEGMCTAFYGDSQSQGSSLTSMGDVIAQWVQGRGLNAGRSLSISAPSGATRMIPASPGEPGAYGVRLGLEEPGQPPAPPLFLKAPQFTITGGGGAIGPLNIDIAAPPEFAWTNRAAISAVDRAAPLTVHWRGVAPEARLFVFAAGSNSVSAAGETCYCAVKAKAGQFTIPAALLANVPPTVPSPGRPTNLVALLALRLIHEPSAVRGLNQVWAVSIYATGRQVTFH